MALSVVVSRRAARRLRRAPADLRVRLVQRIQEAAEDPTGKGAEPLEGYPDYWRVRVGGWRILYSWTSTELRVEAIGPRGQVYRDFSG